MYLVRLAGTPNSSGMQWFGFQGKIHESFSISLSSLSLSLQSAREVKAAIEDLLREKFSCDDITVQSADEYHCHQRNKVSHLRANVSTYFAKERVEQFYSYLKTEKILLFHGTVEVSEDDSVSTPEPSSHPMIYMYAFIVVLFCVVMFFIVAIVLMIKKYRKKVFK